MTLPSAFVGILPTVTRSVNTGSQGVALGTAAPTNESTPTGTGAGTFPSGFAVRVANAGSETAFIAFGQGSAATATVAASTPILGGVTQVFEVPAAVTHISAITASGTTTIYATPGQGL